MDKLQYHFTSNLFPLMHGSEYDELVADIAAHGLCEPIYLHPDGTILDGRNRYRACLDADVEPRFETWDGDGSAVEFVISKNLHRRHLTSSQRAVIALDVLPMLEREAMERQAHGQTAPGRTLVEKVPQASDREPRARDKAAELFSTNPRYVQDAKKLQQQAPDLLEQVRTGDLTIPKAKQEIKKRQSTEAARPEFHSSDECIVIEGDARCIDTSVFPHRYRVIVADPPWQYRAIVGRGIAEDNYGVLSTDSLCDIPVDELADDSCVLFLWATWPMLPDALQVMRSWGFEYKTGWPWVKTTKSGKLHYGVGRWIRGATECILMGVKGDVGPTNEMKNYMGILSPVLEHSRKPSSVHQIAETFPGPHLELFARESRPGWTVFGMG